MNDLTRPDEPQSERANYGAVLNGTAHRPSIPDGVAEAPSKPNAMRNLTIREVNRGFIVEAGCHTFAISTARELTQLVTQYINDPSGTEMKWHEGKLMER